MTDRDDDFAMVGPADPTSASKLGLAQDDDQHRRVMATPAYPRG
jgi:hypothetical protein